jgi:hypothetical protein
MTECRSPELQDLLPDYVAESLDDVGAARVASHVAECQWCADDLAVLRLVRASRPRVAVPDIARIVAALPHAPASGPRLVREGDLTTGVSGQRVLSPPSMHARKGRGQVFGMSVWRLAATLGVVIAGGTSLLVARRGVTAVQSPAASTMQVGESASVVATLPSGSERPETVAVAPARSLAPDVSVSYGDLGDYTEAELQRMLDRLDQWDGATNTEPLPGVPITPTSGGSAP